MSRPLVALLLFLLYAGLAFGLRSWQQKRRTGSTGFVGVSGRLGSAAWLGGLLFALAMVLAALAPLVEWLGLVAPIVAVPPWLSDLGVLVVLVGTAATMAAQGHMGASWRIGVRATERTELVVAGAFAVVRNPIFSAMLLTSVGFIIIVPNPIAVAAFAALLGAVELQVRVVEEPYLLRVHGERYRLYMRRVGRFVPGFGNMS